MYTAKPGPPWLCLAAAFNRSLSRTAALSRPLSIRLLAAVTSFYMDFAIPGNTALTLFLNKY